MRPKIPTSISIPDLVKPHSLDSSLAMLVATDTPLTKMKGERDTEFVKRIVAKYLSAQNAMLIEHTLINEVRRKSNAK